MVIVSQSFMLVRLLPTESVSPNLTNERRLTLLSTAIRQSCVGKTDDGIWLSLLGLNSESVIRYDW